MRCVCAVDVWCGGVLIGILFSCSHMCINLQLGRFSRSLIDRVDPAAASRQTQAEADSPRGVVPSEAQRYGPTALGGACTGTDTYTVILQTEKVVES